MTTPDILMLIAVTVFSIGGLCALLMKPSWKAVAISWGLLAVGCVFFGIGLTISR